MIFSKLYKRFLLVLILVVGTATLASAQSPTLHGNEWIDYSKTYYKLKVVNSGLHRLSYGFLDSLGLSGTNPQHFQLFRRGKEVAIHVAGESDGRLDPQDFVEFYGERNDGRLDQDLYKDPTHQIHQFYSLYTDTAAYFLTINTAGGKRMQSVNPAVNGKTPEPYHLQKVVYTNTERFYHGLKYSGISRMSWMDDGKGYFSHSSRFAKSYVIPSITNVVTTGPKPVLEYAVGTLNHIEHKFDVNLVGPDGAVRVLKQFRIFGDRAQKSTSVLEFADIHSQGRVTLQTVPETLPPLQNGDEDTKNQVSFSFGMLTFPQRSVFSGNSMFIYTDSTRTTNPYFEFIGATGSVVSYDVSDPYNVVRIEGHVNGQLKGFVIPTTARSHKVLLANTAKPFKPRGRSEKLTFRSIEPDAFNYIIVTNKRLMKVVSGSDKPAPVEYAAYRASAAGGGYDTLLLHMDQIVDQFHYGEFSSNAIKKLMDYMLTSSRPKHLFLLGKGMKYGTADYQTYFRTRYSLYHVGGRNAKVHEIDLVPTGMEPSSDVFFTADFRNNSFMPRAATGRLPATKPEEIITYLSKIKEYEGLPEGLAWRKNILQLGGGKKQEEIDVITGFLKSYKSIAEGPLLGANVIEKYRQSVSQAVEEINIAKELNAGVSMLTFFGHSSSNTTDLDIGFVSDNINGYRNKGKYPVILMNGCNLGDAYFFVKSFGEDWLLTPDRGAVSMIAHSDLGEISLLNNYSKNYYQIALKDENFYGRSIGEIQKETIRRINVSESSYLYIAMLTQMVLQGDPAVKPYAPSKPDYLFDNNTVTLRDESGEDATAVSENLVLKLNVNNLGKAITDSVNVSVKRTLANNTALAPATFKVKAIFKRDQLQLTIPNADSAMAGLNRFEVKLDHTNSIDELNEENNILQFQYYLPSSGLSLLAPVEYAIVSSPTVNLVVQSTKQRAEPKGVYFELDTTHAFNSSIKRTHKAEPGVMPAWEAALPLQQPALDSTVFYWRARFDSYAPGEDTVWVQSSFRYIQNNTGGWSQSHAGQFTKAQKIGIDTKQEKLKWDFSPLYLNLEIRTVGGNKGYIQPPYGIFINGVSELSNACGSFNSTPNIPRIYFIVFNNTTLERVTNIPGQVACIAQNHVYEFGDLNNPINQAKVDKFLQAVPEGYYVVGVSVNKVPFSTFSAELKAAFNNIGSRLIDNLQTSYPFAIVGQKGAVPGTAQELSADSNSDVAAISQEIALQANIETRATQGTVASTIIGPALSWGSLHHNIERYGGGNDSYKLSLYGINENGNRELLSDNITSKTYNLADLNAAQYPNLQLMTTLTDTEARTAPQLKQWVVQYQAAPEGVIRPDLVEVSEQIITNQASRGAINVPMAFQNITPYAFRDSLTVEVTVTGEGIEPMVSRFKIEALEGNKIAKFNFGMPTLSLDGSYKLSMYVNPRLQPEQQYQNNIYEVNFAVRSKLHPILDVAFDGVHIMDGELVSPSPLISITMKDENKHAFLKDPSAMVVYLIDNNTQVQHDITIGNNPGEVQVFPADDKNDFRFEYKPKRLDNGIYTLVVNGRDISGKASGISPYRINFEVENESKITNFYPYPNPFSTKTQFIFTLTGGVIPSDFKIQIMTVTGKVVKEIMRDEIGPIRIGNNKTEYAWDGTDMYGDKLANGVYLYRVVMPKDAEEMKHIWKKGDKGFVNGYGKIYILR